MDVAVAVEAALMFGDGATAQDASALHEWPAGHSACGLLVSLSVVTFVASLAITL